MKFVQVENYLLRLLANYTDPKHGEPNRSPAFGIVPVLEGSPGIGKTSLIRQVCNRFVSSDLFASREEYLAPYFGERSRWATRIWEPAQMDVPDVRGYLTLAKDQRPDGSVEHVSTYSRPPVIERMGEPRIGVAGVDEMGQAEHDMQKAFASFLLEGRVGDYTTNLLRWGATNKMTDQSGVKRMLAHFRNRVKFIELEPQAEALTAFCAARGFPPLPTGFISFRPGVVFGSEPTKDNTAMCTPRSFVSAIIDLLLISDGPEELRLDVEAQEHVEGWIGKPASLEFFRYMEVAHKVPHIDDIVKSPDKVKIPEELSAKWAAMGLVIHHVNDDNVGALLTFVSRLPKEMQVTIVHAFHHKARNTLHKTPEFAKWVSNNHDIILAVAALGK